MNGRHNAGTNRVRQRKETPLPTQTEYTKSAIRVNPSAQTNAFFKKTPTADVNTLKEARQTVRDLAANEGNSRLLILRLHDKALYRALRYSSFAQCVKAELGWSRRTAYRRLTSAQVAAHLGHTPLTLLQKECQFWHSFWADEWYAALAKLPEAEWLEAAEEIKQMAISREYKGAAAQFHEQGQITGAIVREIVERRLAEQERDPVNILPIEAPASHGNVNAKTHSVSIDPETGRLHCVAGNGQSVFTFLIEPEQLEALGWHWE